jgi:hypothetical protein
VPLTPKKVVAASTKQYQAKPTHLVTTSFIIVNACISSTYMQNGCNNGITDELLTSLWYKKCMYVIMAKKFEVFKDEAGVSEICCILLFSGPFL